MKRIPKISERKPPSTIIFLREKGKKFRKTWEPSKGGKGNKLKTAKIILIQAK